MKNILKNFKFVLLGLMFVLSFSTAKQASAIWLLIDYDEPYQVVAAAITVDLSGTTPITQPNSTTTLSWVTTGSPDSCDATTNGMWTGAKSPNSGNELITDLYSVGTYTYEIICHKAGFADASDQVQIDVLPPNGVTVVLSAFPHSHPYGGGNSTLTWSSTGATTCNPVPPPSWNTGGAVSGNDSVSVAVTTTYTVICDDGMGNSAQAQATVTVLPQQSGMTVQLSANPGSMTLPADQTTLSWVTTGAPDSCVASNGWSGNKSTLGGSEVMSNLSPGTHIYTITCSKTGYPNDVSQVHVVVSPSGPKIPTATLFANPSVLPYGGGLSTLTWSSTFSTTCTGTGFDTQGNTNGSVDVTLSSTTTYSVQCYGFSTSATANSTVVVLDETIVNGRCSATHFNCVSGTYPGGGTGGSSGPWTWSCQGSGGGSTAACFEGLGGGGDPQCSDGADNDTDTFIDIADPGCHTDGNAGNDSSYDPNDNDENDTTGLPQCSDLIDNDGDGKIDYGNKPSNDPGCSSALDNSENNNPKPKQIEI